MGTNPCFRTLVEPGLQIYPCDLCSAMAAQHSEVYLWLSMHACVTGFCCIFGISSLCLCKIHVQSFKTLYYPPPTFRPPSSECFCHAASLTVFAHVILRLKISSCLNCYDKNIFCNGTIPHLPRDISGISKIKQEWQEVQKPRPKNASDTCWKTWMTEWCLKCFLSLSK